MRASLAVPGVRTKPSKSAGVFGALWLKSVVFSVLAGPAGAPHEPVASDDELVNRFQTATTGIVMVRFWRPLTIAGVTFF